MGWNEEGRRSHPHPSPLPSRNRRTIRRPGEGGDPGESFDKLKTCSGPDPGTNESHCMTSAVRQLFTGRIEGEGV